MDSRNLGGVEEYDTQYLWPRLREKRESTAVSEQAYDYSYI